MMKSNEPYMPAEPPPYPGQQPPYPAQQPPPPTVYAQQPQGAMGGPPPYGPPYYEAPPEVNSQYQGEGKWQQNEMPPSEIHVYPGGGAVIGTPVTVVHVQSLGPYPQQMTCQACHAQITTTTKPNSGLLTWLIAGGLCLLGCWLGCCLIPFCVDACQDVEHSCPNCKAAIGSFRRL